MSLSSYSATGNLGRDAETRHAGSSTVASFPLAVTVGFGERQSTMWVRCNIWGARATGKLIPYLVKGQSVAVSGELTENAYTGNDGIEKKRNPGKPINVNMYEEGHKVKGAKKLPLTLDQSISHLEKNKVLQDAFGKDVINSYVKLKNKEIKKYNSSIEKKIGFKTSKKGNKSGIITQWEKDNTLDC